jgi:dimeric dUTPase (all-alpha-NTP-PPase superfamily)
MKNNVISIESHTKFKKIERDIFDEIDNIFYAVEEIKTEQCKTNLRMEYQMYVSLFNHYKDAGTNKESAPLTIDEWLKQKE